MFLSLVPLLVGCGTPTIQNASGASSSGGSEITSSASSSSSSASSGGGQAHPLALVYRGPAGCDGCSEAVAAALQSSSKHFDVTYVGPHDTALDDALLSKAMVYAQPGGDGTVESAFAFVAADSARIRAFVEAGGRYLGFCMGGYFAGAMPGFQILPGDTDGFISSKGASVTSDADTLVDVIWRGKKRSLYFQDGPYFILGSGATGATGVTVLATYASNGLPAAVVAPFGMGKAGVVGPHPEAPQDWYDAYGLHDPDGLDVDLAHDLIETTMQ